MSDNLQALRDELRNATPTAEDLTPEAIRQRYNEYSTLQQRYLALADTNLFGETDDKEVEEKLLLQLEAMSIYHTTDIENLLGIWVAANALIRALEADNRQLRQQVASLTTALSFAVIRAADYEGDVYSKEELTDAQYIVFISNGDSYLLNTVEQIEALISDELFLHGYDADAPDATRPQGAIAWMRDGSLPKIDDLDVEIDLDDTSHPAADADG